MTDTQQIAPQALPGSASGLSIASLVLGILGLCCPPLSITALVLGLVEWNSINNGKSPQAGYPFALTGWVLGIVGSLLFFINLFVNALSFIPVLLFGAL